MSTVLSCCLQRLLSDLYSKAGYWRGQGLRGHPVLYGFEQGDGDQMVQQALAAGGFAANDPVDMGFSAGGASRIGIATNGKFFSWRKAIPDKPEGSLRSKNPGASRMLLGFFCLLSDLSRSLFRRHLWERRMIISCAAAWGKPAYAQWIRMRLPNSRCASIAWAAVSL